MNKLAQDRYIKSIFKTDNYIDLKIDENINKFIEEKEKTITRRSIKISLNTFSMIAVAASFILFAFVGVNIRAKMLGKPNIISTIQALFTKIEEKPEEELEKKSEEAQIEETQVNEIINDEVVMPSNEEVNEVITTRNTKNETSDEPRNISQEEALDIAKRKYGIQDQNIGVGLTYKYAGMVKDENGNEYYSFDIEWMYSYNETSPYLTTIYVSKDGTSVKESYNPKNSSNSNTNAYTEPVVIEINEETISQTTIPKERTDYISDVYITYPNVPVSRITLYDGTQIGSSIVIDNHSIEIYNTNHCNQFYHFKNFEDIKIYIRDNSDAEIKTMIINGQEWMYYKENFDTNTIKIRLFTLKNDDIHEVEAYYSNNSEEKIMKVINSINIPEG